MQGKDVKMQFFDTGMLLAAPLLRRGVHPLHHLKQKITKL
jgi:hypothetical protein